MIFLALAESIQLVPDGTLLIHILIIILMIFILNHTLYKPVIRLLTERDRHTFGRSDEARNIIKQVEERVIQYEISMRDARAEGYRVLEQTQKEAERDRGKKIEQVREEILQVVEEQKQNIKKQSDEARINLETEARQMAATVSSQILKRPV